MDFLYDENDRLYGFVLDKTAMYFYVRDVLESILGIIDKNGNLVVQYAYNAWGKPESIIGTLATTVGEHNPFRYKGYHFDSDTGMYYCHTRYYVPDWCRWLNADNIAYVSFVDLTQTNLFVYCGNNPIIYCDANGTKKHKSSMWKFWVSVGIVVGLSIAVALTGGTILAAAAVGAGVGLAASAVSGTIEAKRNGGDVSEAIAEKSLSYTITGGLSTVMPVLGLHLAGLITANMAIGTADYGISCLIDGETPTMSGLANVLTTSLLIGSSLGLGYNAPSTLMGTRSLIVDKIGSVITNALSGLLTAFTGLVNWGFKG